MSRARARVATRLVAVTAWATLTTTHDDAVAKPQISTGARIGAAGESVSDRTWQYTNLYAGFRGDVLFGRESNADFGGGPYADVSTSGFDDVRLGAGASGVLPVHLDFPLVVSAGAYAKSASPNWHAGFSAELLWGFRSFNYHAVYSWSAGLFAGVQADVTSGGGHTVVAGAQLDNAIIALPFVILVNWFREP